MKWNSRRIDQALLLLTVCLLVNKALCGGPTLSILPPNPVQYFEAGSHSALMCQGTADDGASGDAFTEMKWLNPRGEIITDGNPSVRASGPNSLKLSFENPTESDSGYYNCTALYRNTETLQASTFVTFYEGISWEKCETEQSLIRDGNGEISCKPTGNPTPNINWEKDGLSIDSERFRITAEGIFISNVKEEDKGLYRVEAFVPQTGRNERRDIHVAVHTPPRIIKLDEEFYATEGEEYVIECQAEGFPKPMYSWYDPQLRDLSSVDGFTVDQEFGGLTIHNIKGEYRGNYTCKAENSAGKDKQLVKLIVLVKPVIRRFENITVNEGDEAIMVCEAFGDPEPTLSIRKDVNRNLFHEDQGNHLNLETDVVEGAKIVRLNIKPVKRTDDGLYYCSAENGAGRVERVGHIQVQFAPNMSLTPTTTVKAWASNPTNLSCIAEANPNATIIWTFKSEKIQDDDPKYKIFNGASYSNLLVKIGEDPNMDVFGTYRCEAQNIIGKAFIDIVLELATTPGILSQVLFEEVKPTTMTFKLLGPSDTGGLPVVGYVVRYWKTNEPESTALIHEWPKSNAYSLTNMEPSTKYTFKFAAKNAVGTGQERLTHYQMPDPQYPETATFRTQDGSTSKYTDRFLVEWNIPSDNGAPIDYFEVRYFKAEHSDNGLKDPNQQAVSIKIKSSDVSENPSFELISLSPNTWYKVELRAHNRLGNSIPGYLTFRTKEDLTHHTPTSLIDDIPLKPPIIIAIVVVAVLILLILLDITSYLRFHCGLLYLMRYHTCGRSSSAKKVDGVHVEDGRECVKEISTANNGKIKSEIKLPSPKALSPVQNADKPFNHTEDKPRPDGVYPAYENNVRPADLIVDESFKNSSPSGSRASIGKSSPV